MLLIQNKNNQLEEFKPLFETLSKGGYGKLTSGHFVVETKYKFTQVTDELRRIFNVLQHDAEQAGFKFNCFCFNI